jgi:hypothetical protein
MSNATETPLALGLASISRGKSCPSRVAIGQPQVTQNHGSVQLGFPS